MRKIILFLAFFLVYIYAKAQLTFEKTYGGFGHHEGRSVQQTNDGGLFIAGWSYGNTIGVHRVFVAKMDALGDVVWSKYFRGPFGSSDCNSGRQTADGGYILTGLTQDSLSYSHIFLIKTDGLGSIIWSKSFSGPV